jgi:hypothetical protein
LPIVIFYLIAHLIARFEFNCPLYISVVVDFTLIVKFNGRVFKLILIFSYYFKIINKDITGKNDIASRAIVTKKDKQISHNLDYPNMATNNIDISSQSDSDESIVCDSVYTFFNNHPYLTQTESTPKEKLERKTLLKPKNSLNYSSSVDDTTFNFFNNFPVEHLVTYVGEHMGEKMLKACPRESVVYEDESVRFPDPRRVTSRLKCDKTNYEVIEYEYPWKRVIRLYREGENLTKYSFYFDQNGKMKYDMICIFGRCTSHPKRLSKFCKSHMSIEDFAAVEIKRDELNALKEANDKKNYEVLRATPSLEIRLYFFDNTKRMYSIINGNWCKRGRLICQFKRCWKTLEFYERSGTTKSYCFSHLPNITSEIDLNAYSPIEIVGEEFFINKITNEKINIYGVPICSTYYCTNRQLEPKLRVEPGNSGMCVYHTNPDKYQENDFYAKSSMHQKYRYDLYEKLKNQFKNGEPFSKHGSDLTICVGCFRLISTQKFIVNKCLKQLCTKCMSMITEGSSEGLVCCAYPPKCTIGVCAYCLRERIYNLMSAEQHEIEKCELCERNIPKILMTEPKFFGGEKRNICFIFCYRAVEYFRTKTFTYVNSTKYANTACVGLDDKCKFDKGCYKCDIRRISDLKITEFTCFRNEIQSLIFERTSSAFTLSEEQYG